MKVAVHAAAWPKLFDGFGAAPSMTLSVDGEFCEFAGGTTRAFRFNDDATGRGAQSDVPGEFP